MTVKLAIDYLSVDPVDHCFIWNDHSYWSNYVDSFQNHDDKRLNSIIDTNLKEKYNATWHGMSYEENYLLFESQEDMMTFILEWS